MEEIGRSIVRKGRSVTQTSFSDVLAVLRDTAAGYAALTHGDDRHSWPDLELVAFTVKATNGLAPAQALDTVPHENGWVRYRSAAWRTGAEKLDAAEVGPPIAAEFVSGDGAASVHVRQDPDHPGKLARWDYTERPLRPYDVPRDGERPALRERIMVMARSSGEVSLEPGKQQPVIWYHVMWGADPSDPHAIRRLFGRFVGFGMGNLVVRARPRAISVVSGVER